MIFKEDLQRFLERGDELGFNFSPDNANHFGWILLRKEKVNRRYLSLLESDEDLVFIRKQKEIEEKPYIVQIIELERSKHEDKFYQEEFSRNEIHRFFDLETVQNFLNKYQLKLKEIKWRIEIDAP